ncbi:MAG: hypothetical protein SFV54_28000 [Bryobacteraceae bacterium]|nr:hypothetical protein [Bryobacteraceae bacterium]
MSLRIAYDGDLLEEIRRAVVDRYQRIPRGGMEMGGVLFGTRNGNDILVQSWEPIACEYAQGPVFELSEADQATLREQLARREHPSVIGWFRSRRQGEMRPKPEDVALHFRYFSDPSQFLLLLRPSLFGPTDAALFLADVSGTLQPEPAHQFQVEPAASAPPPARAPRPPLEMRERPAVELHERVSPPPAPLPAAPPPPEPTATRRLYWSGGATAVLLAALLVSAGFLVALFLKPSRAVLTLTVKEEDERRLRVQWDRFAAASGPAVYGTLDINDGGVTRSVTMTAEALEAGSAIYARLTDDVQFRLAVQRDGQTLAAATRYLGAGSARRLAPDAAKLEQQVQLLIRERDDLKARLEKLTERAIFAERQLEKLRNGGSTTAGAPAGNRD